MFHVARCCGCGSLAGALLLLINGCSPSDLVKSFLLFLFLLTGGGEGEEVLPPQPVKLPIVKAFSATGALGFVELEWINPDGEINKSLRVQRSTAGFPVDQDDGDTVYFELLPTPNQGQTVFDFAVLPATTYFYAVFIRTQSNVWTSDVIPGENADQATIQAIGGVIP